MLHAVQTTRGTEAGADERRQRVDLAAMFRIAARLGWHEAVANHFSLAASVDGRHFLVNPRWKHFSRIRASDLLLLDSADPQTLERPDAPDPTAWMIHGHLHRHVPQARCVLHVHPPYCTALAALKDPSIPPVDQNTARFFRRVAIDRDFGGMAETEEEGARIAAALGSHRAMIMGNHGVLTIGDTVAEAFDAMYYLELACRTLVLAYSTGKPLAVLSDEVAERTALGWETYSGFAEAHFAEMKAILDASEPDYLQ
jgi:ribulose-5-phosphate 4-epimerase/fuculose-1-phosphate aldolase